MKNWLGSEIPLFWMTVLCARMAQLLRSSMDSALDSPSPMLSPSMPGWLPAQVQGLTQNPSK